MSVGIQPTKQDLDNSMGTLAKDIKINLRRAKEFKQYFDAKSDLEIMALGYTQGEVNIIRGTFTDLNKLNDIFEGTVAHTPAADLRLWAKQVWGAGGAY